MRNIRVIWTSSAQPYISAYSWITWTGILWRGFTVDMFRWLVLWVFSKILPTLGPWPVIVTLWGRYIFLKIMFFTDAFCWIRLTSCPKKNFQLPNNSVQNIENQFFIIKSRLSPGSILDRVEKSRLISHRILYVWVTRIWNTDVNSLDLYSCFSCRPWWRSLSLRCARIPAPSPGAVTFSRLALQTLGAFAFQKILLVL